MGEGSADQGSADEGRADEGRASGRPGLLWQPAAGRLLVSTPVLGDPNFARSLVLLLDVDEHGVLGVILNRPSQVPVAQVLQQWGFVTGEGAVIYSGGPVEPEAALGVGVLADDVAEPVGWRRLFDRTGLVDLDGPLADYQQLRIFAGYAGWSAGQLEAEIAEGAWFVVPATATDLREADPESLWRAVLARQPAPLNLLVTMPADVGMN